MVNNLLNSNINISKITDALTDIKTKSYQHLLMYQKSSIGVDKVRLTLSGNRSEPIVVNGKSVKHMTYHINYDFVMNRNHIRHKNFQKRDLPLSLSEIDENRSMFNKIPLYFINGKIANFVKIRVRRNEVRVLISVKDYIPKPTDVMDILFIPNNAYNPYHSDYQTIVKYKNFMNKYFIEETKIDISTASKYTQTVKSSGYAFKAMIRDSEKLTDSGLSLFSNTSRDKDDKRLFLNLAGVKSYIATFPVIKTNGNMYIEMPDTNMPIPPENIIPLNYSDGGYTLTDKFVVNENYHNIYSLTSSSPIGDTVKCLVFYDRDGDSEIVYERHIELYRKVMEITPYNLDTFANELYRNYTVDEVTYGVDDYHNRGIQDNIDYRIQELQKIISKYPHLYSVYLNKLVDSVDGYYVDMKNVDYNSKLRDDSYDEAIPTDDATRVKFLTSRVLIIFKNDDRMNTRLRLFIDGILYIPDFVIEKGIYDYYYIPTVILTSSSLIEVERTRFRLNQYDVSVDNDDGVIIVDNPNKNINYAYDIIRISDINLLSGDGKKYLNDDDYDLYYKGSIVSHLSNIIIDDEVLIKVTNPLYTGSPLKLLVGKVSFTKQIAVTTDTNLDDYVRFKVPLRPNPKFVRFYRNSRLINPNLYEITSSATSDEYSYAFSGIKDDVGDIFTVDYSSIKYEVEYSVDRIPSHGLLDMRGLLDKPLSFKWYDFYLNGKRLSPNTAEILSPYLMRINPSVKTLKNFFIVSRDSDDEILTIKNDKTITESLLDVDKEFERRLKRQIIEDTEPDIITEIIESLDIEFSNLYLDVVQYIDFFNPRIEQLDDKWYKRYARYYEDPDTLMLGKEIAPNGGSIMINPREEKILYDNITGPDFNI